MYKLQNIILFICLLLYAGCAIADNIKNTQLKDNLINAKEISLYQCYLIKKEPVLDGKVDDDCWQFIPEARCFFLLGGNEFATVKPSWFKAGWDNENFYFAFKAEEPDVQKIEAKRPDGDKFLWMEDSVELFLIPPEMNCWQFIVNTISSKWNAVGIAQTVPLENWQAKSFVGKDFWSVEIKIPFKVLGKIPSDGEKWKINVGRNNLTGPAEERVSCWPKIQKSFHEVENYGTIVFKKKMLNKKESDAIEHEINEPRYNILKWKITSLAQVYEADYKPWIEKAYSIPSLKGQGEQLANVWSLVMSYYDRMKKSPEINLKEISEVLLKTRGLKEKTEELKKKVEMESLFN
ncbi:MAG: carbohydrate-binding family 9-like protein [Candidatus Ratteibacteria bacterium]